MSTLRPLPCPFCGGKPKVDRDSWTDGTPFYYVACMRKRCYAMPSVCTGDKDDGSPAARRRAIRRWNKRVKVKQ